MEMMAAHFDVPSSNHSSPDWNCLSPIQGLIEDEPRFDILPEPPSPQTVSREDSLHSNNWVHVLLSYGGEFACMSGKCLYRGGKTKLMRIGEAITYSQLLVKVTEISSLPASMVEMRYRYPSLEMEAPLIVVEDDNDIKEMMHVFLPLSGQPPVQLFVFAVTETTITTAAPSNYVKETDKGLNTELTEEGIREPQLKESRNLTRSHNMRNDLTGMDLNVPHEENGNELLDNSFGLEVGQEFSDIKSIKNALREHAMRFGFQFKSIRTDPRRFTAKCADEGCAWRIHASNKGDDQSSLIKIKSLQAFHTCRRMARSSGHRQATRRWIADCIKTRLAKDRRYSPKQIVEEMRIEHGISVSYTKAWRGRELALKLIQREESGMDV